MYDNSGTGIYLRRYMNVALAPWHNYKWATFQIARVFGRDFIGPFFHTLFPNRSYDVNKMHLPSITTLLSYICMRLAYPSFKQQLVEAREIPNLTPRSKSLLENMLSLFEFFIPVVRSFYCWLYNCIRIDIVI